MEKNLDVYNEYGFPLQYSEEKLTQMRNCLAISPEQFENIRAYFEAANNLYALIPLRVLLTIYNQQNTPVSQEDFLQAADVIAHEGHHFCVLRPEVFSENASPSLPIDQEIVAEHVCDGGDCYYEIQKSSADIPWYIPNRAVFLQYTDQYYVEKTPQFMTVVQHLQNTQRKLHNPPMNIVEALTTLLRMDMPIQSILCDGQRMGLQFQNQQDFQVFLKLLLEQSQHTRRFSLRGHTPAELGITAIAPEEAEKIVWDSNYKHPLTQVAAMLKSRVMAPRTISGKPAKNALCPCGSGRKYKNCCGKSK